MGKITAGIVAVATACLAPSAAASVLVVGDSLEVGSAPHLRGALSGIAVDIDAKSGRTSSQGVAVLARRLRPEHDVVVFPLGTNDTSPDVFAGNLATVQQLAGGRCIVVATIARPPLRGSPAEPLNQVVARLASRGTVQVVDWRSAAASPGVLGRDDTHATGQGYALRAALLAEAVRGCLSGGGGAGVVGGIPAPEDPNVRVPPPEGREPAPRPRPRPAGPPARPAKLPARAVVLTLRAALSRAVSPVAAAFRDVRTAAMREEPEPVLGAP